MGVVRVSRRWLPTTGVYTAVITVLTWSWISHPGGFKPTEAAAFVLLLPTIVVTLPLSYVVLPGVWVATSSSEGQGVVPAGVVTAYCVWFALLAIGNALVITAGYRALRPRRRQGLDDEPDLAEDPERTSPGRQ